MNGRLAVATGTRAEYGILRPLLAELTRRKIAFELYVTGTHLSPFYGDTVREIESDGYQITEKVDIIVAGDSANAVNKSMALALMGFSDVLTRRKPDLLIILGDRFEMFSIAAAATVCNVAIAHLHGGERTEGLIDEAFRHSITKMSHVHFVATEEYKNRVLQLGETTDSVHCVGALGLDNINSVDYLSREELEESLDIQFRQVNFLVTFHPLTLDIEQSNQDFDALLRVLEGYVDVAIVFTDPNADTGGASIQKKLAEFALRHSNRVKVVSSLGTRRYFSMLKMVDVVIGNSSSGLIEVPSFLIPTINIGNRQKGRVAGESVINADANEESIRLAIKKSLDSDFIQRINKIENPYGRSDTARKIVDVLEGLDYPLAIQKSFQDIA